MTHLQQQLLAVKHELPEGVRLVAVSKFHPVEALMEAYEMGQRIFGESRVQELQQKQPVMPNDVEWHLIGHLQANKVKYIAPYITMIHSVDSRKLLQEIHRQGERNSRVIDCLLQLHVAQEETKFGFSFEECRAFLEEGDWKELSHIRICGLMCMATFTEDTQQIRQEFATAYRFFKEVKAQYFAQEDSFKECSWGMSDDYPIAITEGSTLVRVGSKIFGERVY